jgi:hypothetical protein
MVEVRHRPALSMYFLRVSRVPRQCEGVALPEQAFIRGHEGRLSRTIARLDENSPEAPTSLAETLGRLLAVSMFADTARGRGESI